MGLRTPDPDYTGSVRAKENFVLALKLATAFVLLIWVIYLLDWLLGLGLLRFGLRPRDFSGLVGVISVPLLHGNIPHLVSNSVPLFVALTASLYLYPNSSLRALPLIYLGSSLVAWTFARPNIHVGASGFVYGLLAFVFLGGLLRADLRSIGTSLMIWFVYGSMVWGVLPGGRNYSWELHLAGAGMGVVAAILFRRWDRAPEKRYDWEDEPAEGEDSDTDSGTEDEYWLPERRDDEESR